MSPSNPQCISDLGAVHHSGVQCDEPQHQHPVDLQIGAQEVLHLLALLLAEQLGSLGVGGELEVAEHEAEAVAVEEGDGEPVECVEAGHHEEDGEPEPDEDEDLLVEDVDHQHTLHRVALDVAQHTHLQLETGEFEFEEKMTEVNGYTRNF